MLYRVIVNPTSSFIGDIRANTLFGAFCTVYSSMVSDEDFDRTLKNVTFSNLFLNGELPVGVENGNTVYNTAKVNVKTVDNIHSKIDRNTGKASMDTNGTYKEEVKFTDSDMVFYIDTDMEKSVVNEVVNRMLKRGLGKRRNVGKGQFELKALTEAYLDYRECNEVVALSDFIPDETTPTDISEIGITFRNGVKEDGTAQNSLCLLKTGTKFKYKKGLKMVTGKLIYDNQSDSYVNAKTILYPLSR